jgi:hypothetical protein
MVTKKEPITFPCIPLNAVLTERACQNNQLRARAEKAALKFSPNIRCLTCPNPIKKLDETLGKEQVMPRAGARKAPPRCPEHPNEIQAKHPNGGYIGKCEICLGLKPEPLKTVPSEAPPKAPEPEGEIVQAEFEAPAPPMCKTHPDRPAVINRKGVSMGKCRECLVRDGKNGGRITGSPVRYILRDPRHQELLKFLQESAEENERTLEQEVIYCLKKTI